MGERPRHRYRIPRRPHGSSRGSPRSGSAMLRTTSQLGTTRATHGSTTSHGTSVPTRPPTPQGVHDAAPNDIPTPRRPAPDDPRSAVPTRVRSDSQTGLTHDAERAVRDAGDRPPVRLQNDRQPDLTTRPRRGPRPSMTPPRDVSSDPILSRVHEDAQTTSLSRPQADPSRVHDLARNNVATRPQMTTVRVYHDPKATFGSATNDLRTRRPRPPE